MLGRFDVHHQVVDGWLATSLSLFSQGLHSIMLILDTKLSKLCNTLASDLSFESCLGIWTSDPSRQTVTMLSVLNSTLLTATPAKKTYDA